MKVSGTFYNRLKEKKINRKNSNDNKYVLVTLMQLGTESTICA